MNKHRSIRNWMNNNFMDYKNATELTKAAMGAYRMVYADDEVCEEIYNIALTLIKEP